MECPVFNIFIMERVANLSLNCMFSMEIFKTIDSIFLYFYKKQYYERIILNNKNQIKTVTNDINIRKYEKAFKVKKKKKIA